MKRILIISLLSLMALKAQCQWTKISLPNTFGNLLQFEALTKDTFYALGVTYYPHHIIFLYRSADAGNSWTLVNTKDTIRFMHFFDSRHGYFIIKHRALEFAGKQYYTTAITNDGGKTVTPWGYPLPDNSPGAMFFWTRHRGIISQYADINSEISIDGGHGWSAIPLTYFYYSDGGAPAFTPDTLIAYGVSYHEKTDIPELVKTIDGGLHWDSIGNKIAMYVKFPTPDIGYWGTTVGDSLLKTIDGGKTWNTCMNGIDTTGNGYKQIIPIYFTDSLTGYVCTTYPKGVVYKTIDGGRSWHPQLNVDYRILGQPFWYSRFFGKDTGIFAAWGGGNNVIGGIYYTTNGGGPFLDDTNAAIEPVVSSSLKLYPNPSNDKIYIERGNTEGAMLISVFDMEGNIIHQQSYSSSSMPLTIDVSNLRQGLYMLQIESKEGIRTEKFEKN